MKGQESVLFFSSFFCLCWSFSLSRYTGQAHVCPIAWVSTALLCHANWDQIYGCRAVPFQASIAFRLFSLKCTQDATYSINKLIWSTYHRSGSNITRTQSASLLQARTLSVYVHKITSFPLSLSPEIDRSTFMTHASYTVQIFWHIASLCVCVCFSLQVFVWASAIWGS